MAGMLKCPSCGEQIEAPEEGSVELVRCPACRAFIPTSAGPAAHVQREPPRRFDEGDYDRRSRRYDDEDEDDDDDYRPRGRRRLRYSAEEAARSKVLGPGILLQVSGAVTFLSGLGACVLGLWIVETDPVDGVPALIVCYIAAFLCFVAGVFLFIGGSRLKALRSYGLVLAVTILIFVLGVLFCIPLVLVGIWPLIVLLDSEVKEGFEEAEERRRGWQ